MTVVRVGPAGWSYDDWKGVVYPGRVRQFGPLEYLSRYFDTIEINSAFYRTPPPTHSRSWVRRVGNNEQFKFTTKLFQGFTHAESFPLQGEIDAFRGYLEPLLGSERLGGLLAQFPWSFRDTSAGRQRIESICRSFPDVPIVVEVRHGSFANDNFFEFLEQVGAGFANVDQPVIGDSMRPTSIFTGHVGYARLHGRNYEKWFDHKESWERYDYLYSPEELAPWIERVKTVATKGDVYVITNNHFRGQAIVNAIELKRGLGQQASVPEPLAREYGNRVGPAGDDE